MPQELRARLSDAAEANGRSLNREIVQRLESSLEEPAPTRRQKGEELVRRLPMRRPLVAVALLALVAVALAVFAGSDHGSATAHTRYLKNDPDARTSATRSAGLGSPDSELSQEIAALAYPSSSLKESLFTNARSFYGQHIKGRSKKHSKGWQLAGPQTGTQPAVLNFFDFQASDFQVSGRVTAMAVDPSCDTRHCRLWIAAAGGGIWRNDDALSSHSKWTFVSDGFGTNAIGTLTYDAKSKTLYAGTGEPNASGDSESGVGIYASRDGGNRWDFLPGSSATMRGRSISAIVVDPSNPKTLYVGTARGVRGVTSVTGGAVSLAPDAAPWGLWRSTDGGKNFTFLWDGNASIRGITNVEFDSHGTLYASAFQQGIWRSSNGGSSWEQVFATKDVGDSAARTAFDLTSTSDGHTRIYVGDGGADTDTDVPPHSNTGVYRGDAIDTKTSAQLVDGGADTGYVSLTDPDRGRAAPTYDYCDGQCWYDNYVVSPAGHPDMVYVGGSFDYNLYGVPLNNGRAVLLSQDAGKTWNDMTRDAAPQTTGIHPDQHALVVDPANPLLFFEGSDGGVIRSSGQLTSGDPDTNCATTEGAFGTTCKELLTQVPTKLTTLNEGLSTLQFQNAVPSPSRPGTLIGGTQDNGTWLGNAGDRAWNQTIYGDGGVAAFDASNKNVMMNEFFGQATDMNFRGGDPTAWVIVGAPFYISGEASAFYKPQIGDPNVSGTFFAGLQHVWRTTDSGGDQKTLEANCQEFTVFADTAGCGDFKALGDPAGAGGAGKPGDLTGGDYGTDRAGGYVVAVARTSGDDSTLWAATATGRVFITKNANATDPGTVSFTRLDSLSAAAPTRFVSGIVIDPNNPNRAWVTYTGYNANTPGQPGHVFQVDYNPTAGTATFKFIDNGLGPLGDLPVTGIARDDSTGTLYVGTDFSVLADSPAKDGSFDGNWRPAADGMPQVEIAGVNIDQSTGTLYAATHGRGIWSLKIGDGKHKGKKK
jgi:Arc-like DNA binding dprotein